MTPCAFSARRLRAWKALRTPDPESTRFSPCPSAFPSTGGRPRCRRSAWSTCAVAAQTPPASHISAAAPDRRVDAAPQPPVPPVVPSPSRRDMTPGAPAAARDTVPAPVIPAEASVADPPRPAAPVAPTETPDRTRAVAAPDPSPTLSPATHGPRQTANHPATPDSPDRPQAPPLLPQARPQPARPAESPPPEPLVEVHIGRVEIAASDPPAPELRRHEPPVPRTEPRNRIPDLDAFLAGDEP